jgi:hypothetical protein
MSPVGPNSVIALSISFAFGFTEPHLIGRAIVWRQYLNGNPIVR